MVIETIDMQSLTALTALISNYNQTQQGSEFVNL